MKTIIAVILVICPVLTAAQGFPPAKFTNLQVLPGDAKAAEVIGTMKTLTMALGVRCQHCHVGEEAMPLDKFDFAADVKAAKTTARAMMRMVAEINTTLDKAVPAPGAPARVTCWTCHSGKTTPARQQQ